MEQRESLLQEKIAQMEAQRRELAQKQQEQQNGWHSQENAASADWTWKERQYQRKVPNGESVTGTSSDMRKQKAEHDTREERKVTGQKERRTSGWVWLFLLASLVFSQEQGSFSGRDSCSWRMTGIIAAPIH